MVDTEAHQRARQKYLETHPDAYAKKKEQQKVKYHSNEAYRLYMIEKAKQYRISCEAVKSLLTE